MTTDVDVVVALVTFTTKSWVINGRRNSEQKEVALKMIVSGLCVWTQDVNCTSLMSSIGEDRVMWRDIRILHAASHREILVGVACCGMLILDMFGYLLEIYQQTLPRALAYRTCIPNRFPFSSRHRSGRRGSLTRDLQVEPGQGGISSFPKKETRKANSKEQGVSFESNSIVPKEERGKEISTS